MAKRALACIVQGLIMLVWPLFFIGRTDSYDSFYVVVAAIAYIGLALCARGTEVGEFAGRLRVTGIVFGACFTICALLANYAFLAPLWVVPILLVSGFFVGVHFFSALAALCCHRGSRHISHADSLSVARVEADLPRISTPDARSVRNVFVISFIAFSVIFLAFLFLVAYPGILSRDSIWQVGQALDGEYSNHHPFWHTIIISLCVNVGQVLFGDVTTGVALYSALQSVFMAACFAYALAALKRFGVSAIVLVVCGVLFALLPFQLSNSVTMWKNIPFAGCVLVFSITLFELLENGKGVRVTWLLFLISGIGMALLQHNGPYALLGVAVLVAFLGGHMRARVAGTCAGVLVLALVANMVLLPALGVKGIPARESASVPLQQIARAVVDDGISAEQRDVLQNYIDYDSIPELYMRGLADPVKWSVDNQYYVEHRPEFFALWLQLGFEHPKAYVKAWVDLTKGYWFGSYGGAVAYRGVFDNDYGITTYESAPLRPLFSQVSSWFYAQPVLAPLYSIGLAFWITAGIVLVWFALGRRAVSFMGVPSLLIVATLFISVPIFGEFRYVYSLFLVLPVLLSVSWRFKFASLSDGGDTAATESRVNDARLGRHAKRKDNNASNDKGNR